MNEPWLRGKWNEIKGRVKEQWGELSDDEIARIEGRRDQLIGAIQQRYGKDRDAVEKEIREFERRVGLR
jgi:uncharacterized protein YjbJ (UPF0337 family)